MCTALLKVAYKAELLDLQYLYLPCTALTWLRALSSLLFYLLPIMFSQTNAKNIALSAQLVERQDWQASKLSMWRELEGDGCARMNMLLFFAGGNVVDLSYYVRCKWTLIRMKVVENSKLLPIFWCKKWSLTSI